MTQLPIDLMRVIFGKQKVKDLVGDDILDRYIIFHCPQIEHNRLLQWLSKKNKIHSVILLLQQRNEDDYFYYPDILQNAYKSSVHSKKLSVAKIICKYCPQFITDNRKKLFQIVFSEMIKDKRTVNLERMTELLSILGHQPSYLSKHLIWRTFNHKSSPVLCEALHTYGILDTIIQNINTTFDAQERQDIISTMIFYNNYMPLRKIVTNPNNDLTVNDLVWASLVSCDDTVVVCLDGFKQKRFNQKLKKCIAHVCLNRRNDEISRRIRNW
jgi:hypothetical protein